MAHASWLMAHASWLMPHASWLMPHGLWLMPHGSSELPLDLDLLISFNDITNFDVVKVFNIQTTFKS